jgi:hypothetical protein
VKFIKVVRSLAAVSLVALASASAWAQSYTVSSVSGQWIAPPTSGATNLNSSLGNLDDAVVTVSTPFPIVYWGTQYSSVSVGTNGQVVVGGQPGYSAYFYSVTFPLASGNIDDGMISVARNDLDAIANSTNPVCQHWVSGTAPNRKWIIAWTGFHDYLQIGSCNFQIQFHESTNWIVMAYDTTGWSANAAKQVGLDKPGDSTAFAAPSSSSNYTFTGAPANDWRFAPPITISGTVLFDRYLVDATGIGGTSDQAKPLAGIRVEQRDATGTLASAVTNSSGFFSMSAVPTGGLGTIVVTSQATACAVRKVAGGALYAATVASNVAFTGNIALGTVQLSESTDPGGVNRAPINVARTIQTVYDWARSRTAKTIPLVDPVLYDVTSSAASSYTPPNGLVLASMRVSGASANPDPWDLSVITKSYGRHVLGAISGFPSTPYDQTLDLVTDDQNAFAEGFGYYLHFAVNAPDQLIYYDGVSGSKTNTIDIENLVPTAPRGPNVAGWVAAALYDLSDSSVQTETWDTYDGSAPTAIDRPFRAAATLTAAATAKTFTDAWYTLGYDGAGLVRNFIHHGLILDDADEPNDFPTETKFLSTFGFIRTNRVLSPFNEDWYEFTMPDPTNHLTVSVVYDRIKFASTVLTFQTLNAAGDVVATGTVKDAISPYVAVTGSLPAGNYRLRVALASGSPVDKYTVQAFSELAFKSGAFLPWTVGRPINVPVEIKGGIPPYTLTVLEPFKKPDGLILDGVNLRVGGIPTGPQDAPIPPGGSYKYGFILSAQDAATPANTASGPIEFVVNDTLKSQIGDFLAVPYNKPLSREAPYAGGTAPYTATVDEGLMPHGISFAPGELTLVGTADVPGSYPVQITAKDVALSAATSQTTGVCCTPLDSTTPLALGAGACGFYFDAVQGSTVAIAVKTAPKQPKRLLRASVLDTDGTTVLETNAKGGKGKAGVKFVAPSTGRFYFVLASDSGDASLLVGAGKVAATKSGNGENPDPNFVADKLYTVKFGALAGAKVTFVAKPDRSGLALTVLKHLVDPNGNIVSLDPKDNPSAQIVEKNGSVTVKVTLPTSATENLSGTWKLIVSAYPGPQGHFTYSFRITEPKSGVFAVD